MGWSRNVQFVVGVPFSMGQLVGICDNECIVKTGQMLGADKILTGGINNLENNVILTIKIYDVESGLLIYMNSMIQVSIKELFNEIGKCVYDIIFPYDLKNGEWKANNIVQSVNKVDLAPSIPRANVIYVKQKNEYVDTRTLAAILSSIVVVVVCVFTYNLSQ